ncbi:DUF5991 domain-containing protein [Chryseobacterium sp. SSA4.19]|uniref:DUF5991 domain-containing protein n=1 Tax=Chryseobacterium sp. SSA4.19 TaxID=2919915 RepID=UPI001F4DF19A|nr:DUF5991 domain-containing protein [Chryseobacterium sp. SSA4.19]MCJ8155675.1 DUF5991 domain-containing protein [Chryseobacterium sp. SSA4.19]
MEIRLNKTLLFLIFLLLLSCKGGGQENKIQGKEVKQTTNGTNFFDKKFENSLYSLIIDESNISDHPIKSYLDCAGDGYFTIHYIPKTQTLQHFWKDVFLEKYDFNSIDLEKDDKRIREILKKETNDYNIFSYQIKNEYLDTNGNCSEESVYAKNNSIAEVYYYNSTNKSWNLLKKIKSEKLPPYLNSAFFLNNFPEYFPENKIQGTLYNGEKQSDSWKGVYNVNIDYGKLDNASEMSIDYTIEVKDGNCTFSGMGYKTYFTDQCKIEEKNNTLILSYEKNIEGDGFSDHSNMGVLGVIILNKNKYYIKSPIVANDDWSYNTEIELIKK